MLGKIGISKSAEVLKLQILGIKESSAKKQSILEMENSERDKK